MPGYLYLLYLRRYGHGLNQEFYNFKRPKDIIRRFIFGETFAHIFVVLGFIQIFMFGSIVIYGLVD